MKRSELVKLRAEALQTLRTCFHVSLDTHPERVVDTAQIAAADALHRACSQELEDGLVAIETDVLFFRLRLVQDCLVQYQVTEDPRSKAQMMMKACDELEGIVNVVMKGEDLDQGESEVPT